MAESSPFRRGLSAVRRQPALVLAEIAWRWSFGVGAWAVVLIAVREFLVNRPVSDADVGLLASKEPTSVAFALADILQGSGRHLLLILGVMIPALTVLWVVPASLGRAGTLKALLGSGAKGRLLPQFGISFLRAALALATVIAFFGANLLIGLALDPQKYLGLILLLGLALMALVGVAWGIVNWFLSLAPIFVARDGRDTLSAIGASLALYRRRSSGYLSLATAFGVVRGVALIAVLMATFTAASMAGSIAWQAGLAISIPLALIYFAVADGLYVARLAAYVALAEQQETPAQPPPEPAPAPRTAPVIDTSALST